MEELHIIKRKEINQDVKLSHEALDTASIVEHRSSSEDHLPTGSCF
jgi:hypothetical protein